MISARFRRRRKALLWSALASAAVHLIVLTLLFYAVAHIFTPRGAKETISQTATITVERQVKRSSPVIAPVPAPAHPVRVVVQHESAPARARPRELAKVVAFRAPALPPRRPTVPSRLVRDEAGFAKEVAQLNRQNDPHAIPTIDPGSQESPTKRYAFAIPSSLQSGSHGNGVITPTQSWRENGLHCYRGRYDYTYPDGAVEYGDIVWPFCYDPGSDPFVLPPHEIPFPFPRLGFKLPPDTQFPPIEKSVYEQWARDPGLSSP